MNYSLLISDIYFAQTPPLLPSSSSVHDVCLANYISAKRIAMNYSFNDNNKLHSVLAIVLFLSNRQTQAITWSVYTQSKQSEIVEFTLLCTEICCPHPQLVFSHYHECSQTWRKRCFGYTWSINLSGMQFRSIVCTRRLYSVYPFVKKN